MAHPKGRSGTSFRTNHTFAQAYALVGSGGFEFQSNTGEMIAASQGLTKKIKSTNDCVYGRAGKAWQCLRIMLEICLVHEARGTTRIVALEELRQEGWAVTGYPNWLSRKLKINQRVHSYGLIRIVHWKIVLRHRSS
jgi:hypothetical protein